MAGRRFTRGVRRGPVRQTQWGFLQDGNVTMTGGGGTLIGSGNAELLDQVPFTIVRVHMDCWLRSDQAAAIENQSAMIGWAVVSDQAVAIGVTAIPTPLTDMGSDLWFLHKTMFADESNLTDRTRSGQYFSVDSKAMRKVEEGQDIVIVSELGAASEGGVILTTAARFLIKLH